MSSSNTEKVPLMTLTMMVVGGMVGAGVFSIPRNFAMATGAGVKRSVQSEKE